MDKTVTDTKIDFVKTWLMEMPKHHPSFNPFSTLKSNIEERKKISEVKSYKNIFFIEGPSLIYAWINSNNEIAVAIELEKKPQSLIVNLVGKNPNFLKTPPYTSDLYLKIIEVFDKIVISDNRLTDEGFGIWKKLLSNGNEVLVYSDHTDPIKIKNIEELYNFFDLHDDYLNYRYVLGKPVHISESYTRFATYTVKL